MKKLLLLLSMMCLAALTMQAQSYVDLGLPSGTKWKTSNEKNTADANNGFFTYDEAVSRFGKRLPTKVQWEELKDECQWSWIGNGYRVTGPNGNSITLPAEGFRYCDGDVADDLVGSFGGYWSSTLNSPDNAWYIRFYDFGVSINDYVRCDGRSIRLVQD